MKNLKIGVCKIDITPPVGYLLQGHSARNKPSKKIHDPLYLKCLSIFDGENRVFIITSDLIEFTPEFVNPLKKDIYKKFKIYPSNILLTASHTHTGPLMISSYYYSEKPLPDYISLLKKKIIGSLIHCINDEEEGILKFGKGKVNIGIVNRRKKTLNGIKMEPNFEGPIDEEISVVRIDRKDGNPKVIFFNYSCHPTTLSTDIYEISADYPGVAQREIENFYKSSIAMFSNGCCGDVRPAIIDKKTGKFKGGSFENIEKMGKILFSKVVEVSEKAETIKVNDVKGISKIFNFELDKSLIPRNEEELKEICKYYKEKYKVEIFEKWFEIIREKISKKEKFLTSIKGELQVIKIGEISILGLPGEIMVEIGLKIKELYKKEKLIICGYSNGVISYIPTSNAIEEGGYEVLTFLYSTDRVAPFEKNLENKLIKNCLDLLK